MSGEPPDLPGPGTIPDSALRRSSVRVGPWLLGKLLVRQDGRAGRIIEVEAYRGSLDPGSHAYRGPTARNATMFGRPGLLYVYFTYGMHWCANVVCAEEGIAEAVLLRALEPVSGLAAMRQARMSRTGRAPASDRDLCRGPARLCQALGVTRDHDGADLIAGDRGVWLADDGTKPPRRPAVTTRVGLSAGADLPWRWLVPGHVGVSRPAPAGAAHREESATDPAKYLGQWRSRVEHASNGPAAGLGRRGGGGGHHVHGHGDGHDFRRPC